MVELLNSMVRLSAAVTVFGIQEVQSAVGAVDTKESMDQLRGMIDAMTNAVTSRIDENRRSTVKSISNLGEDVVSRTVDTLNVPSISPREFVKSTADMVKSTSDWLDGIVKPAPAASEPKSAEEALAS